MEFYIFSKSIKDVEELIKHNYTGGLFIYSTSLSDFFTQIARTMNLEEDFKYMVAVRPYAISPQYLFMINDSINSIDKDRLQINFISGSPANNIVDTGGILGEIKDSSSLIDKSDYLIKYIDMIENPNKKIPDYYISVHNNSMVDKTLSHGSKLLISYEDYKNKIYNIEDRDVMIHMWAVLRETRQELIILKDQHSKKYPQNMKTYYFTYKEFEDILIDLKNKKINQFLFYNFWDEKERKIIHSFVKKYKEKELIQ